LIAAPDERVVQQLGERGFHGSPGATRPGIAAWAGSGQTGRDTLSNDRSIVNFSEFALGKVVCPLVDVPLRGVVHYSPERNND
jgi:hypothetical protein